METATPHHVSRITSFAAGRREAGHLPVTADLNEACGVLDGAANVLFEHVTVALAVPNLHPLLLRILAVVDFPVVHFDDVVREAAERCGRRARLSLHL